MALKARQNPRSGRWHKREGIPFREPELGARTSSSALDEPNLKMGLERKAGKMPACRVYGR